MKEDYELKDGQYLIETKKGGEVVGRILCSRPGLRLIDFYRTSTVLVGELKPVETKPL